MLWATQPNRVLLMYEEDHPIALTVRSALNATWRVYNWLYWTTNTHEFVTLNRHEFVLAMPCFMALRDSTRISQ